MNTDASVFRTAVAVDYLIAKRRSSFLPPRLVIVHGHHRPGTLCLPGESVEDAHLSFPERDIPVSLSQPGLMLCDCMVRHHHTPLSIARMERILTSDPFYRRLGSNGSERLEEIPMFTRVALRVYISRLREQIGKALKKGGSMIGPKDALVSETTDSNVVIHRIGLRIQVVHR